MSESANIEGEIAARRSHIVLLIERMETPVTIDQLVDELDAASPASVGDPGQSQFWEARHEHLHDEDIPVLDRAGLLDFDADRGLISQRGDGSPPQVNDGGSIEHHQFGSGHSENGRAERSDDRGDWAVYYLGAAILSLGLLVVVILGIGPFSRLPPTFTSVAMVSLYGLLALVDMRLH